MRRHSTFDLIGPLVVIATSLALLARVVFYFAMAALAVRHPGNDFGIFYQATLAWKSGGSLYEETVASRWTGLPWQLMPDLAPPHLHLALIPLVHLEFSLAMTIWIMANLVSFAVSLYLVGRELGIVWRASTLVPLLAVCALVHASYPMVLGQYAWLLMLLSTTAWIALRNGRWIVAFALLGIILSIKPFAIAMCFIAIDRRRYDAILALIIAAGACAGAGVLVFGLGSYTEWMQALSLANTSLGWLPDNLSIAGFFSRLFTVTPVFGLIVLPTPIVLLGVLLASAVVGISTIRACRGVDVDRAWVALWSAAFLILPIAWPFYLWWILPPVILLFQRDWRSRGTFWFWIVLLMIPMHWTTQDNAGFVFRLLGYVTGPLIGGLVWFLAVSSCALSREYEEKGA